MTTEEFVTRLNNYRAAEKRTSIPALLWMFGFAAIIVIAIAVAAALHPELIYAQSPPHWWDVTLQTVIPVWLGGMCISGIFMFRNTKRNAAKFGLHCPHCGNSIAGMGAIVVASQNCGHCGERLLCNGDIKDQEENINSVNETDEIETLEGKEIDP